MPKTLHPLTPSADVLLLQRRLHVLGYGDKLRINGFYDDVTLSAVHLFQAQHIGPSGKPLDRDGVVGPATWWALNNPSGPAQKSNHPLYDPSIVLTPVRARLMTLLNAEYSKGVHETPDGSNRSPVIDRYWGDTGILGQPWCCAFVSTMLRRCLGYYPFGQHHISVRLMYQVALEKGMLTSRPTPGCVFVMLNSDGTGHTGFGTAFAHTGWLATLEGNTGNRLKNGRRRASSIDAWLDPFQDNQVLVYEDGISGEGLEGWGTR